MQPAAQMSIEELYDLVKISSGARYQRVTTYSVIGFSSAPASSVPANRASPKSHSFKSQSRWDRACNQRGREVVQSSVSITDVCVWLVLSCSGSSTRMSRTLTSKFPGFRSRCQTFAEWMYLRAQKIYGKYRQNTPGLVCCADRDRMFVDWRRKAWEHEPGT